MAGPGVTTKYNHFGPMAIRTPRLLDAIVVKATADTEAHIKANIVAVDAVDTGNMLNTTQGHHEPGSFHGTVDTAAEYWVHVNYGTHKMAARPFREPAIDAVAPGYHAAIKQALEP